MSVPFFGTGCFFGLVGSVPNGAGGITTGRPAPPRVGSGGGGPPVGISTRPGGGCVVSVTCSTVTGGGFETTGGCCSTTGFCVGGGTGLFTTGGDGIVG